MNPIRRHIFLNVVGWFDNPLTLRPDLLMLLPNIAFQSVELWIFHRVDRS